MDLKNSNGQYQVKLPAAIDGGMQLDGASLRWEFVHNKELKLRVEPRPDSQPGIQVSFMLPAPDQPCRSRARRGRRQPVVSLLREGARPHPRLLSVVYGRTGVGRARERNRAGRRVLSRRGPGYR